MSLRCLKCAGFDRATFPSSLVWRQGFSLNEFGHEGFSSERSGWVAIE